MNVFRITASVLALSALTLLAACGGGGGGGATPPTGNPGGGSPPPTATPHPTSTPSPTPAPTSTPSGGTIASNGTTVIVQDGTSAQPFVFGHDNWQTNGVTDSASAGDGDTSSGFTASHGGPIDGVACTLPGEPNANEYHVHSFVGLYVNGTQYAIPDAIGMLNPSGDGAGATLPYPNEGFSQGCTIHTHSTSGVIHIEDNAQSQSYTTEYPQNNLQSLLDIWGQGSFATVASMAASGFSGPVSVYVGTPCPNNTVGCASPQKNPKNNDDIVTKYVLQSGALSSVVFGHHVAIWVVVGSLPAGGLPAIDFGISN